LAGHLEEDAMFESRIAHRSHIHHDFLLPQNVIEVDFFWRQKVKIFGKNPWNVRVPLEAVTLNHPENLLHLALIVDVFREDILIQWIPGTPVHEHEILFTVNSWKFPQKFPPAICLRATPTFQLLSRPENRSFGTGIETHGVEQCPLIVISQQREFALGHHSIDTFTRVRPVAHNVAQTVNLGNSLAGNVRKDCLQRFQISVDVAENGFQNEFPVKECMWANRCGV
jgi:hypothetical protein